MLVLLIGHINLSSYIKVVDVIEEEEDEKNQILIDEAKKINCDPIMSRTGHSPIKENSPYQESYKKGLDIMNKHIDSGADPKIIGQLVYKILNTKNPKKKYLSGSFIESLAPFLKFILPQRLFEYIVMKNY